MPVIPRQAHARKYEPDCEKSEKREDCFLQLRSIWAAELQAEGAKDQAVYTWWGLWLLFFTLLATAWAAHAAAQAARTATHSVEILRGLERPHLFFDVREDRFHIERVGGTFEIERRPQVTFGFTNFGKTSAILGWLDFDFVHLTEPPTQVTYGRKVIYTRNRIVRPDGNTSVPATLGYALSDAAIETLRNGRSFLWLYGALHYTQSLNEIHVTEFCWCYNGLSRSFEPFGHEHNRMS